MKQYYLKTTSKNKKSFKNFLHFFFKHLNTKFNVIQKPITINNNRKIVTLLKSPHVNKTAQEHFEVRLFTKKIFVKGICLKKNLMFLKKILDRLFQDVHIQLEFDINKNENKINELLMFSSDDFKLLSNKKLKTNFTRNKQKIKSKEFQLEEIYPINLTKFLQIISTFGEVSVRSSIK